MLCAYRSTLPCFNLYIAYRYVLRKQRGGGGAHIFIVLGKKKVKKLAKRDGWVCALKTCVWFHFHTRTYVHTSAPTHSAVNSKSLYSKECMCRLLRVYTQAQRHISTTNACTNAHKHTSRDRGAFLIHPEKASAHNGFGHFRDTYSARSSW